MEERIKRIRECIDDRRNSGQLPYKAMFDISLPKYDASENEYENPIYKKIINLFSKYSIGCGFVDTVSGAFNLNREWLETQDDVECYVEYCGVYPINWDIEDIAELERMEYDGEIIVFVYWHEDGKFVPNH